MRYIYYRFAWRFSAPGSYHWRYSHPFGSLIGLPLRSGFGMFWTHRKQKAIHQIQSSPLLQYTFELRSLSSSISWQSWLYNLHRSQSRVKTVKCWGGGHPARARLECDRPWGQEKLVFPKLRRLGNQKSYLSIACRYHVFALCDGIDSYRQISTNSKLSNTSFIPVDLGPISVHYMYHAKYAFWRVYHSIYMW